MNTLRVAALVVSAAILFACAGSVAPDAPESSAQALRASEPAPDVIGTWGFDLDASDVAAAVHADCNAKPDPKACWTEIAAEAKREKIRFAPGPDGHTQWTSFALEADAKEVLFLAAPVDLSAEGSGHVLAKIAGPATGPQAKKSIMTQLRLELVDAQTLVVNDPRKGRLVYSKE